jgi:hypothetical protein
MLKIKFTLFVVLSFCVSAFSMSFFSSSKQGIGIRQYITDARGMGMGNTGLAIPSKITLNAYNVATWRYIDNTRMSVLMYYNRGTVDFPSESFKSSTGRFSGIQFAVPLQRHKWILGLSITPYSLVDFSYIQHYTTTTGSYDERISQSGSITRAQLSLAWAPVQKLGFSVGFNYYFGTIQDQYRLIIGDPDYLDPSTNFEYRFRGPGAGFSFDYLPIDSVHLGGYLDLKPNLNLSTVTSSPITLEESETNEDATLPLLWGIGSSYHFAKQWNITADYTFQNWSEGFGITGIGKSNLEDWYNFGVGIERAHLNSRTKLFLNKIDLRTGFSIANIGYKFNGNSITEYSGHFGLGLPFHDDKGRLDIAFVGGIRGTQSKNLAKETFYRIYISLSAGELWFQNLR